MDRTVPTSGNEEIQLYLRTYYSLLKSSREVKIKSLVEAHKRTNSALHVHANEHKLDINALTYSVLRMPPCLVDTKLIIMGQSDRVFAAHGYDKIETWEHVNAPGRRRKSFYDGNGTLAVYIASRSDIDDIVPILVAYEIERNKLRLALRSEFAKEVLVQAVVDGFDEAIIEQLADATSIDAEDWGRVEKLWGKKTADILLNIAQYNQELAIRSLAGSIADYKRATRRWWRNVEEQTPNLNFDDRPVYFVSSNTHSIPNLLSGYALAQERMLQEAYIDNVGSPDIRQEYQDIMNQNVRSSRENFLYYVLKKHEAVYPDTIADRHTIEQSVGITRFPSEHSFDIEIQVVELSKLNSEMLDPRLQIDGIEKIVNSDALIINIDYPLGLAAYQVLSELARNVDNVRGIYIIGKAATLNGRVGDVMIPNVVHDEHSLNTYLYHNVFTANDIVPYLAYGACMDNQKAITVPGTFLQNEGYMSIFYKEGYTDMEMEAGPYLSAIAEMVRPRRYPHNEIVDLHNAPFPIGILHYASDTPFSKGMNLGAQTMSYFGIEPTYATSVATLKNILQAEIKTM